LQNDAPWVFCFHPKSYTLWHSWMHNIKPSNVGHNTLKYHRIDPEKREEARDAWNKPVLWPLVAGGVFLVAIILPAIIGYRRRERHQERP